MRRIREIDQSGPMLRSIIEVNSDALAIAEALDAERSGDGFVGRCTVSPSSSRTASTPVTRWPQRPVRWP
ncbi:peptide amidase domain protein [Mycobacterium ulcerans str. Harvey]|uniref:Peptide amidase domain protein n=1 Tax=Mycobacterium ulcerans str. Harvey TaxID=1299332 RepID=A0ABN0RAN3_MYCUL|nr:peptide amidase domain protein [Mycobacterium ulcerans str. Harvey]